MCAGSDHGSSPQPTFNNGAGGATGEVSRRLRKAPCLPVTPEPPDPGPGEPSACGLWGRLGGRLVQGPGFSPESQSQCGSERAMPTVVPRAVSVWSPQVAWRPLQQAGPQPQAQARTGHSGVPGGAGTGLEGWGAQRSSSRRTETLRSPAFQWKQQSPARRLHAGPGSHPRGLADCFQPWRGQEGTACLP